MQQLQLKLNLSIKKLVCLPINKDFYHVFYPESCFHMLYRRKNLKIFKLRLCDKRFARISKISVLMTATCWNSFVMLYYCCNKVLFLQPRAVE